MIDAVEIEGLTHRYGRLTALREVNLTIPAGAVYALLGPNGSGKTTLLQILMGLRRPTAGRARVLGRETTRLRVEDRASIGYVAEGQRLPGWMTLDGLERYLAPLYPTWDHVLATELRRRFRLDEKRRIRTLSRGEQMKAALLCTLVARPRLLLMDEPFTGMDVLVKDELVAGLLEAATDHGTTILICTHDMGEIDGVADWVGILDRGRLRLSEPVEVLHERFRRVEVVVPAAAEQPVIALPSEWLAPERRGPRVTFLIPSTEPAYSTEDLRQWFPGATRIEIRPASLREMVIALARSDQGITLETEVGA